MKQALILLSGIFFAFGVQAQNVGVGQATPISKLDVNGGLTVGATYSGTNAAPTNGALIQGSVGIGTTSPASKLDVEGGASIGATYSGTTAAPTNGAIIEGSVGIGTTSPASKLDVEGGVSIGATYSGTTAAPTNGAIIEGKVAIGQNSATQRLHIDEGAVGTLETVRIEDLGTGKDGDFGQTSGGNIQTNTTTGKSVYVDGNGDMTARYAYGDNIQTDLGITDLSINSTSFTDTDLSITFTPRHSTVYLSFVISGATDSGGSGVGGGREWVLARIMKDGVRVAGTGQVVTDVDYDDVDGRAAVSAGHISIVNYPVTVVPGTATTIKVQWRTSGSRTFTSGVATNPDFSHRSLTILD